MADSFESSQPADLRKARRQKVSPSIERLPPHAAQSEMAIVGCCLMAPNECINECVEKGVCGGDSFYDLRTREVMETMVAMHDQLQPVDMVTLQQWLRDNGVLEQIGGIPFLAECQDLVPSAANLSAYIEDVLDRAVMRDMIRVSTECVADVYDFTGTVDELLEKFEQRAMSVRRKVGGEIKTAKTLVSSSISQIEKLYELRGSISGLSTGLSDLDRLTDGLHGGEMIIIAGWEKAGKTALAMGIIDHIVVEQGLPAGAFPLEMSGESLMTRMICSRARVNLRKITDGFMAESDFPKLTSAAGRLSTAALYIDDSSDLTIGQLRAKARRMKQNYNVAVIVVDYAQLVSSPETRKRDNREQEVSAVSKGIKAMAKELNIPVLLLSQLNDEGKLRESRALSQDADAVWKLKYEKEDDRNSDADSLPMILRVDRSRNGGTGNVPVIFFRSITKFEQAAKHVSDDDVPTDK